jgi:hypothetical protein
MEKDTLTLKYQKVTLEEMLLNWVNSIVHGTPWIDFYYYDEEDFHEIVECDLERGRFITDNQDFSEFDWELKESHIYKRV